MKNFLLDTNILLLLLREDPRWESLETLQKGISKQEIVLGYFPDYHRAYTEYAVS
ncbi:MAG: XisI protein [Bacteroidota bacterium]|jgi:predicted nucleic acid-binding protein